MKLILLSLLIAVPCLAQQSFWEWETFSKPIHPLLTQDTGVTFRSDGGYTLTWYGRDTRESYTHVPLTPYWVKPSYKTVREW